ncbi:hypothetical protein [Cryptosporangium phraense]|uniref:Uncharacterized protein n=1 Tax=Cryptosporangium phraense TaxID=2593070 RepID=A0A545AKG2_9ACTN|nr:hypothetical protein [Cryptosporangium phraense]TQS41235.1 hypothetical protein FL583_30405 [Cryptosporangium phraense]
MELILLVLLPLPLGFLVRSRAAAFVAYIAVHSFVFTFQSTSLTLEWVRGSTAAFSADGATPWPYLIVNAVIYGIGLGLVALGAWLRQRRETRRTTPVDLAAG